MTFWQELPPHRHGTPTEVAGALRLLHSMPTPTEFTLPPLTPFIRLEERITAVTRSDDQAWLRQHLISLRTRYAELTVGLPHRVLHGDAWKGNVVSTDDGQVVLLDLERCSVGPPEWDLVSTAIKHTSFAWITIGDYQDFCRSYGHDVTTSTSFELLRDIRELRMTCYAAQHANEHPPARTEAGHRIDCLRGRHGARPWAWNPFS
ncbi:phosphotransferase family protein [Actinoalloteichus sp. GBA129-24]|nr:phosphotransferase family protein [Actinoalloteichus sp. GBA129-24]